MTPEHRETVIYIHIPKTGGRTLNGIIRSQYKPYAIFSNSQAVMSRLGSSWEKISAAERWEISKKILEELSDDKKRKIRVILGHMNFGRHKILPQPCTYVTLFREPFERIISHYYHIKRMKSHYLNNVIEKYNMSIGDFVKSGLNFTVDNGQSRLISGAGDSVEYGQCANDMLVKAKSNLKKHFSVVGLTEEFALTLMLLKAAFNWEINSFQKKNISLERPSINEIPKNDLKLIEKYNQLDMDLYKFSREIFKEQIQGI